MNGQQHCILKTNDHGQYINTSIHFNPKVHRFLLAIQTWCKGINCFTNWKPSSKMPTTNHNCNESTKFSFICVKQNILMVPISQLFFSSTNIISPNGSEKNHSLCTGHTSLPFYWITSKVHLYFISEPIQTTTKKRIDKREATVNLDPFAFCFWDSLGFFKRHKLTPDLI